MKNLILPAGYRSTLDVWETEQAIKFIKDTFQQALASGLRLRRITAPIAVEAGTGLNDDLSGSERPVSFPLRGQTVRAEIVQSLAKWKRYALWRHRIAPGIGIYTDMNAIRPDEVTDNTHSIYVDQWDWEKVITPQEKTAAQLNLCVGCIYSALRRTEFLLCERFATLTPFLPRRITILHAEELRQRYPSLTPRERENRIAEECGAVFIRGIGCRLGDGSVHDGRSPDYDDWSTTGEDGLPGLNGDIIIWHPTLRAALEISSMGMRVDSDSLRLQLGESGCMHRETLYYHSLLLDGKLPQTMGGGIGQSRLCMLLLGKCHIGEVQAGIWPAGVREAFSRAGVFLF